MCVGHMVVSWQQGRIALFYKVTTAFVFGCVCVFTSQREKRNEACEWRIVLPLTANREKKERKQQ